MYSLCRLPVAKTHNFGQILTFLGAPVPTPFYRWGPNLVCYNRPTVYAYVPNFVLDRFILSPSDGEKPQFLPYFGLRHFVVSPVGSNLWKLSTGAQLQTLPYPTISKSFLYSNSFLAKSCTQTLTFTSVTNKQTNRQKTQRFWMPRWRAKSEPYQTWHGDRGPRARSCAFKLFEGLMHSFVARGRWKFGCNQTSST